MAFNSGFKTRQEEKQYGDLLGTLVNLMQTKILHNVRGTDIDESMWTKLFSRNYSLLRKLEANKITDHLYSLDVEELAATVGVPETNGYRHRSLKARKADKIRFQFGS
jgi:hypothetical protein